MSKIVAFIYLLLSSFIVMNNTNEVFDKAFEEIDIPNIHNAERMARFLIGSAYGFSSCLAFFLKKVFGINFPDNKHSCNCSETQALILRAGGLDVYPNMNVNEISPLQMFQWVMQHGGIDVTWRYRHK